MVSSDEERAGAEGVPVLDPGPARYAGGAGSGGREGLHRLAPNHRFARAVLPFTGLRPGAWACLAFGLAYDAAETACLAADCVAVGVDCLAGDGSSLDLDHVPGLTRGLLDPHAAWIAGPDLAGPEARRRIAFRVPDQARDLAVTFRSWRNTAPVTVTDPVLLLGAPDPAAAPRRRPLDTEPVSLTYALPEGVGLTLRGQLYAPRPDEHAARVRLTYRDAAGVEIAPPYPGAVSVPGLGAVVNLSTVPQARRFTLALRPPTGAASVTLDLGPWEEAQAPAGAELIGAPEVALEDGFRLESLCGDDPLAGPAFLARLAERLGLGADAPGGWLAPPAAGMSVAPLLARIRATRAGPDRDARHDGAGVRLTLASLPDWTLPAAPDWREDPFRTVGWRLAYQSLSWLLPLAATPEGEARARALAASWAAANPWGHPSDPLSLHPAALAPRADVLARLLSGERDAAREIIAAEAARHGFALAEIVGQNTLARALHGLQASAALLALARALPHFAFAPHWETLACESLGRGFDALLGADGAFAESAPLRRLDLLTHGQGIAAALGGAAPGPAIAERVAAALPGLARLLDPAGRLPPFGDTPPGLDHAAWIARLGAPAGDLVAVREDDPAGREAETPEIIALRYDGPERGWAHFACLHAGPSPQDHRDCTSFVFATGSRRWIVEGGGAEGVETGAARHHLNSARAHNVAWPDRCEPVAGRGWPTARFALDGAQVIALATNVHGPDYAHARIFVVLDDLRGLAVLDRFTRRRAERAISFAGQVQLAPDTLVALSGPRRALAQQDGRRLEILSWTVTGQAAGLAVSVGRSDRPGAMRGFVAAGTGGLKAAPVLRYAVTGRGTVCGGLVVAADRDSEQALVRLLASEAVRRLAEGG
ncbi:heparinase II/III family protein [Methylobacterium sp. Leaf118]|uniref:heparinase II/III family protein n=1 Tax=Methylobacterium sp. Leaf118 TaxID=2876562 RepID=UPI001E5A300D|nr:heparinase II/III family protein [Methylobacterium sp. Leaf118]